MKFRVVVIICCVLFGTSAYALNKGAFTLGGGLRAPLKWDAFGHMSVAVDVAPSAGYFVADQVELLGTFRVQGPVYQSEFVQAPREPIRYGLHFGANYYFDFDIGFYPYAGLAVGAEMADFKAISAQAYVEIPLGIAFLVKESLMIQIGAPIKMMLAPPGPTLGTAHFEWTPGSISARVFL